MPPGRSKIMWLIVVVFCLTLVSLTKLNMLHDVVLYLYVAVNTVTFLIYGLDKSAAKNNQRRVSERTLHLFGLAGGWPGAFAAQNAFKHKRSKPAFMTLFWLSSFFNSVAVLTFIVTGVAE